MDPSEARRPLLGKLVLLEKMLAGLAGRGTGYDSKYNRQKIEPVFCDVHGEDRGIVYSNSLIEISHLSTFL